MTDTTGDDRRLPPALAELARTPVPYADGKGIDFEPYEEFCSAEETTAWTREWTGDPEADGAALRIFGQDGSGGLAALWRARPGRSLTDQPVVFLGSEGQGGSSPATSPTSCGCSPTASAPGRRSSSTTTPRTPRAGSRIWPPTTPPPPRREPRTIKAEARAEFPDFPSFIGDLRL
ncbi:SMI1/KNR4 family protein [Streptomyces sp. MAD19A]|uniref:SMI1/KNR4 family protein n=1 Tax=Streptomyces sp. MAD19A TaxID=3242896 RepID=UPI003527A590